MPAADPSVEDNRASRFLLAILALLAGVSIFLIWPFLTGTIFALVLGFLLQRPYKATLRVVRLRPVAALVMLLFVAVVLVVPLMFVSYQLVQDAQEIVARVQDQGGLEAGIVRALEPFGVPETQAKDLIAQALGQLGALLQRSVLPTLGALASAAANIGVFFFLLYFVLVGGESFGTYIRQAIPLPPARRRHLMETIGGRVRALFLGTFLVAIIQGVAATIGWWYFGFPGPVFWGFVMTLLAVIPVAGPILIMAPAGVYAMTQGDLFAGVGIILYGIVVVGFLDNLTRPWIVGRSSDVHPAVVLIGTLGGLIVFGTTGFIIGPLVLSMVGPVLDEWRGLHLAPS